MLTQNFLDCSILNIQITLSMKIVDLARGNSRRGIVVTQTTNEATAICSNPSQCLQLLSEHILRSLSRCLKHLERNLSVSGIISV